MKVTEEEVLAGAKALCQADMCSDVLRDSYWDELPEELRALYRGDSRRVLKAAAKVREGKLSK